MVIWIAAFVFLLIGVGLQFKRSFAIRQLRRGSHVASTTMGPVEFTAIGSGPAVLVLHGGAGGWDQAVGLGVSLLDPTGQFIGYHRALQDGDLLLRNRFTLLAPSRVGYLRTPLSTGQTPAEGADALVALLDAIGLSRVLVVGISGGGPTALQFALRHRHRCAALLMVAAIARLHVQPARTTESLIGRIIFLRGFGWFVDCVLAIVLAGWTFIPFFVIKKLLAATETFDRAGIDRRISEIRRNPDQIEWIAGLVRSLYPLSARRTGLANDLEQFAKMESYPLDRITCPTMVIHGRHDGNVPFDHAEFVANGVLGTKLIVAETCGHFLWLSTEEPRMRQAAATFLCGQAVFADRTSGIEILKRSISSQAIRA